MRYLVGAVKKIIAQIKALRKKRELDEEIRRKDDIHTIDNLRDVL